MDNSVLVQMWMKKYFENLDYFIYKFLFMTSEGKQCDIIIIMTSLLEKYRVLLGYVQDGIDL